MISILIPVFNQNITKLVYKLHKQCVKCCRNFEIICFDDDSNEKTKQKNREISGLFNVSYVELNENKGRAKIRNLLGKNARFENLLFLDCDSRIISAKYISNYLSALQRSDFISGGRVYSNKPPLNRKKYLHWKYGTEREALPTAKRRSDPTNSFHSNNFVIRRELFLQHQFNSSLKQYGYEDLAFAHSLHKSGIKPQHIDNPVRHGKLLESDDFLNHTKLAISNLIKLYRDNLITQTRLIKTYKRLKYIGCVKGISRLLFRFEGKLISNLVSSKPKLIYLDFLKLHWFIHELNSVDQEYQE